jgi:hypothetical protein
MSSIYIVCVCVCVYKLYYRLIKKSLCTWRLQYRKLQIMFKVVPASLQTFIDMPNCVLEDRVQYSMVYILNVFCDGHLQIINFYMLFVLLSSGAQRLFDHQVCTQFTIVAMGWRSILDSSLSLKTSACSYCLNLTWYQHGRCMNI